MANGAEAHETELDEKPPDRRDRVRVIVRSGERWAAYGWFMSLGTVLPLVTFLVGYVVNLTLVGAPIARRIYELGIWLSTLGQEPPGKEKMDARAAASTKKPLRRADPAVLAAGDASSVAASAVPMAVRDRLVRARRLVARGDLGDHLLEHLPPALSAARRRGSSS